MAAGARQDLPPARFSRDFKDVHRFFQAEREGHPEFALNVWAAKMLVQTRAG